LFSVVSEQSGKEISGASKQFNHDYVCVKFRLQKKLDLFKQSEPPLLIGKGYLTVNDIIAKYRNPIAENCNTTKVLVVAQLGRALACKESQSQ
jgi:hypothetical protein